MPTGVPTIYTPVMEGDLVESIRVEKTPLNRHRKDNNSEKAITWLAWRSALLGRDLQTTRTKVVTHYHPHAIYCVIREKVDIFFTIFRMVKSELGQKTDP